MKKSLAAAGLAAGLLTGGAAGALVVTPGLGVAQEEDTEAPADEGGRPEPGTHLSDALAPLVEDGTLTQEQADAVVEALLDARPEPPFGRGGPGRFGHRGPGLDAAADAIGISVEDLREGLRDGQSIAAVAEEHGADVEAVVDAMVADLGERLSERVADGDLTQEEADEKLAEVRDRLEDLVHRTPPTPGDDTDDDTDDQAQPTATGVV